MRKFGLNLSIFLLLVLNLSIIVISEGGFYGEFDSASFNLINSSIATRDGFTNALVVGEFNSLNKSSSYGVFRNLDLYAGEFRLWFNFTILNSFGNDSDCESEEGGHGLVLVLANSSDSLGSNASSLGYGGLLNSVAIKLDTHCDSSLGDTSSNSLAILLNGNMNPSDSNHVINITSKFDNGNNWSVFVDYNGLNLTVYVTDTGVFPEIPDLNVSLDIPLIIGSNTSNIGFTSGSKNASADNLISALWLAECLDNRYYDPLVERCVPDCMNHSECQFNWNDTSSDWDINLFCNVTNNQCFYPTCDEDTEYYESDLEMCINNCTSDNDCSGNDLLGTMDYCDYISDVCFEPDCGTGFQFDEDARRCISIAQGEGFPYTHPPTSFFQYISPTDLITSFNWTSCTPTSINYGGEYITERHCKKVRRWGFGGHKRVCWNVLVYVPNEGDFKWNCTNNSFIRSFSEEGSWSVRFTNPHESPEVSTSSVFNDYTYSVNWDNSERDCVGAGFVWYNLTYNTQTLEGTIEYFNDLDGGDKGFCCGGDQDESVIDYYYDNDSDDFGNTSRQINGCSNHIPLNFSKIPGDCDDSRDYVHPNMPEDKFSICRDGLDNNCASGVDALEVDCQKHCSLGYTEVLRYSNNSIASSFVREKDDYDSFFPLCVDGGIFKSDLQNRCDAPFIEILSVDTNAGVVASPLNATNSYDKVICGLAKDCEILDSCPSTHSEIASLTGVLNARLVGPEFYGALKLCCAIDEVGVSFDINNAGSSEEFACNYVSDGICPEDFENSTGGRVSCSAYRDPDCGFSSNIRDEKWFSRGLFLNFSSRSYVISTTNSNGSLVAITNTSDDEANNVYTYDFRITSDTHSDFSETTIVFSYGADKPDIFFDDVLVEICESNFPCYVWDEISNTLLIKHPLSSHDLRVQFNYSDIPVALLIVLFFVILIPLILVVVLRKSHLKFNFNVEKLKKYFVHREDKSKDLINYVEKRLGMGHLHSDIQKDLLEAGWKKHIVDMAVKGLHKKENSQKLEGYVLACLDGGVKKSDIYTALITLGWDRDEVDELFKRI